MKPIIILLLALNGCGSAKDAKDASADAKPANAAPKGDAATVQTPNAAPPPEAETPAPVTPEATQITVAAKPAPTPAVVPATPVPAAKPQIPTKDYTIVFKYKLSTSFNGYTCTDNTDDTTKSFSVLKTTYDDYLKSPKCGPFGDKTLSCAVTDNSAVSGTTCVVTVPAQQRGDAYTPAYTYQASETYSKFIEPVWPVF